MAFINKTNKTRNENLSATVIAEGTKIQGDINSSSIYIYGSFEGTIKSDGVVTVSGKGYTKGEIFAKTLVISGLCEGKVDCGVVDILDRGILDGDVICDHLVIEKGGFLQGASKKRKSSVSPDEMKAIENSKLDSKELISNGNEKSNKQ